ncbi:[bacterium]|nr:[FeFe] hydrogenase H-cluster radical SAM maturase HydE [bacterium]
MAKLDNLIEQAQQKPHSLAKDDLLYLLQLEDKGELDRLFKGAYALKSRYSGNSVYLRGLIEMGNVCAKDCFYCGIRKSNTKPKRYQLSLEEILNTARETFEKQYGSLVLQSGEIESEKHTLFIAQAIEAISSLTQGKLGLTLSLGEQEENVYKLWREAGAHRYLLRIETSNPNLYAQLHPASHSFSRRLECLRTLRRLNYQTGSGVMIGLPGQTRQDLADDILFFQNEDLDMIGMGPYIPHRDTPLGQNIEFTESFKQTQLLMGLKMIACTRLQLHDVNIAATTALQALHPQGREKGIKAGANVIMPNVTETRFRADYQLYENKPCLDENAQQCRNCLTMRLAAIGEKISYGVPGDPLHYKNRNSGQAT